MASARIPEEMRPNERKQEYVCSECNRVFVNDVMLDEHIQAQHDKPQKKEKTDSEAKGKKMKIILVGKEGSGKSSAGNVILSAEDGKTNILQYFPTGFAGHVQTHHNAFYTRSVCGVSLTVVDTPGVSAHEDKAQAIAREIREAIRVDESGYDAIVYVINIFQDELSMNDEDIKTYELVNQLLGNDFTKYVILLFTHGASYEDKLKPNRNAATVLHYPDLSFEEVIARDKFSTNRYAVGPYVRRVNHRAVLFENLEQDPEKRKEMVKKLLAKVYEVVNKEGQPFGKDMLPEMVPEPDDFPEPPPVHRRFNYIPWLALAVIIVAVIVGIMIRGDVLEGMYAVWNSSVGSGDSDAGGSTNEVNDSTQTDVSENSQANTN